MGLHKHFPQLAVGDQPEFQIYLTIYLAFQDFIRIITLSG